MQLQKTLLDGMKNHKKFRLNFWEGLDTDLACQLSLEMSKVKLEKKYISQNLFISSLFPELVRLNMHIKHIMYLKKQGRRGFRPFSAI